MKLNKFFTQITVFFFFIGALQNVIAQTTSFNLTWDPNEESDMSAYKIYRSTSPGASQEIGSVSHPTVSYRDNAVEKGIIYYYRLKAVDLSGNASPYSEEVSAAIPLISGMSSQFDIEAGGNVTINLDPLVNDPDDADQNIIWTTQGASQLTVSINNRVATISAPSGWDSQETIIFKATDQTEFFDQVSVVFKAPSVVVESAPEFQAIPEQVFNEDGQSQINLTNFVNDSDSDPSQLSFQVAQVNSIQFQVNNGVLTMTPSANWNGSRTTTVTVTDQDNQSDQTQLAITVNPVNDKPVISDIPQQSLLQGGFMTLDVTSYASDVDNSDSELSWQFTNYSHISLTFDDQSKILQINAPDSWEGFEYIVAKVTDPGNASDTDTLIVRVNAIEIRPPAISAIPNIRFDEDQSSELKLNDYVTDSDDPVQNLFWNAESNDYIQVQINHSTNIATFSALPDWNGNANLKLYVTDPNQNKDSLDVKVLVKPVNDRPHIKSIPSLNLSQRLSVDIDLNDFVNDVDDSPENLTWTYTASANINVSLSGSKATFSVIEQWSGMEQVSVFVTDALGAQDTSQVTVYRQNQAVAPTITSIGQVNIAEDNKLTIQLSSHVTDPDNSADQMNWSFKSEDQSHINISINKSTQEMLIEPEADWFGNEEIFLSVQDPDNNIDFDTLMVVVTGVNDAPKIKPVGNISILQNTVYTIELKDYIDEADGLSDIKEISLLGSNNGFIGYYLDKFYYQLTFFTPSGFFGRETFLLKIKDAAGIEASAVLSIEVLEKSLSGAVQVAYYGSETNLNMAWSTTKETRDYIEFGLDSNYGLMTEKDDDYAMTHDKIISNLQENQTYHFRIVSEDINGSVKFSSDSVFTTGFAGKINVFPIPYQASKDIEGNGIVFANLPSQARLDIFNLLGEPVFKTEELPAVYRWQAENNAGKKVSSGLYVYVIKDQKNKKVSSGKIIIVR